MSSHFEPTHRGDLDLRILRQELGRLKATLATGHEPTQEAWQAWAVELTKGAVYAGVTDGQLREALSRFTDPEQIFRWVI